jgi:hypothetical protein
MLSQQIPSDNILRLENLETEFNPLVYPMSPRIESLTIRTHDEVAYRATCKLVRVQHHVLDER